MHIIADLTHSVVNLAWNCKRVEMKQLIAFFLPLFFSVAAIGQTTEISYYQTSSVFDRTQLKFMISALQDLDPGAEVFPSDDMRVIQVNSTNLDEQQIRGALVSTGVSLEPGVPDLEALYGAPPAVPVYVPTGDPQADHARYVAEVEQWNQDHPEQQLPQPLPFVDEN